MRRLIVGLGLAALALVPASTTVAGPSATGLVPDMRTVMPQHLQLVNAGQKEILRFSNGIANTGVGGWALRPEPSLEVAREQGVTKVAAVQEFRDNPAAYYSCEDKPHNVDTCFNVLSERVAGQFEFHPAHNHWHIGDVALFEVRKGSPTGKIVGGNSIKTTFCLIDWYKLSDNSPTWERVFFDCYASYQGISPGWVDQYHQSTSGQQLDLTGVPNANDYYLVSTSNYARTFTETDYTNNSAWVKFRLYTDSKGNRKIEVTDHSPCEARTGLCGEGTTNR
jgi:Lysyl oxidase